MVKFAEAEKRGRGGDGGDRRIAPVMMLERAKISRGMWESLKAHIMKERRRKKEEIEADEEEKRMRKERENRKKQHAMTLEETREQITKVEQKLIDLKAQKHDLVQQLKKVLNEEKRRKDQEQQQQHQHQQQQQQLHHQQQHNYLEKSDIVPVHTYPHGPSLSMGGHPQMMFPSAMVQSRAANISTLYKVGVPTSQPIQNILPTGSMKRSRSPSPQPPPQSSYHNQQLPYVFKSLPVNQTSVVPVTLTPSRSYYHGSSQNTHVSSSQYPATSQAAVVAPYLTTPAGPPPLPNPQPPPVPSVQTSREEKHLQSIYLPGSRVTTSHVSALHTPLDHKGKSSLSAGVGSSGPFPSPADGQDKFYVGPHLVLHTLPVQQPPPGSTKGGISSGFPVRGPPPPTSQSQSSTPHSYSGHSLNLSRTYF